MKMKKFGGLGADRTMTAGRKFTARSATMRREKSIELLVTERRVTKADHPGAGPWRHPPRHRRDLRLLPQRGAGRPGHHGPPRPGCTGDEVRQRLNPKSWG